MGKVSAFTMSALIGKFLRAVLPGIVKPLHSLWNEVLGALFLTLAIVLVRPIWRGYQEMDRDPAHLLKFLLTVFFFLVMLGFGLHAFWKARRITRS
jgi:hypothetical protein